MYIRVGNSGILWLTQLLFRCAIDETTMYVCIPLITRAFEQCTYACMNRRVCMCACVGMGMDIR